METEDHALRIDDWTRDYWSNDAIDSVNAECCAAIASHGMDSYYRIEDSDQGKSFNRQEMFLNDDQRNEVKDTIRFLADAVLVWKRFLGEWRP